MRLGAIILSFWISFTYAQTDVYWEPENPIQGGQVTIYYNLENRNVLPANTNLCFIHLGFNGWTNTTDYQMTKSSNNLWQYEMTIPDAATIIDFVFTDLQGNWDNNGGIGIDWHIDVYSEGLSVALVSPSVENPYNNILRTPEIITKSSILPITFTSVTTGAPFDSLFLNINGLRIIATSADTLRYNFNHSNWVADRFRMQCIAKDVNGFCDTSEFAVVVRPNQISEIPSSNLIPGITHIDNRGTAFSLFAPYKEYVYLIGDFNNWEVNNDYLMNKYEISPDSILWWIGLPSNKIGNPTYQYLVDGEVRIADPYSELVLDPWNDENIPSSIYPNMPEYPEGKTNYPVSYLDNDQTEFDWQYNKSYKKPEQKDLVIYELLLRDFLKQHDYNTLIDTLDYLQNLGINAIELMPINEFEGNSSWGYNPSFYFAPDKYYGTKNDLKAFIDECHKRGLVVIQDMVLNHSFGQSPLVRLYWNNEKNRPAANNPWYNEVSPNADYSWGYDFNHESIHTKAFVDRVLRYWLEEYKVDGYRLDFIKGYTNTPGEGTAYDAKRIAIFKRIADEVWKYDPSTYLILELFADNTEEKELSNYGLMLWGNANYNYNEATMGYIGNSDFSWGYYKNRGWTKPNLVTYMESHDEERMMYKNLQYGNSSGDYKIKDLPTSLDRQKLAAAFFFTLPGPKMIWQFGELGYDISINYNGRTGEKPIHWDYQNDHDRKELYNMYSQLIRIRNNNEVFRSANTTVQLSLNNSNGLKRIGLTHSSMSVIIIGNFGVTTQSIDPDFYYSAIWYDDLNSDLLEVDDTHATIELSPGEFRIYTNKHMLDVENEEEISDKPLSYSLSQNFPNPFNPITTIRFSLPEENEVYLTIYNIVGQEVELLVNEFMPAGTHQINWDASELTSGVYFYRINAGNYSATNKMLLIK